MYTEDFRRDDGGNRKTVEDVNECLPRLDITPPLALVIKPVYYATRVRTRRSNGIIDPHLGLRWRIRDSLVRGKNSRDT